MIEAQEVQTLAQLLVPALRRLLLELDSTKKTVAAVKRGLRVLRSFLSTIKVKASDVELTLGIDPQEGSADSGDLESDLKDLLLALGEASKEADRPICRTGGVARWKWIPSARPLSVGGRQGH